MVTLIDDGYLVTLLSGGSVPTAQPLATTYHWWWRLSSAVRRPRDGALSGPFEVDDEGERAMLIAAIDDLPALVEIGNPVDLLPVAADLATEHGLNALAAEALAAALVVDGEILVRTDNPRLRAAAGRLTIVYRTD